MLSIVVGHLMSFLNHGSSFEEFASRLEIRHVALNFTPFEMLHCYFVLICFEPCLGVGYSLMLSSSFLIL